MDVLDYMERESAETMRELMKDYAASFDRAVKVATALAGGAAAMMAYAPGASVAVGMKWILLGVAVAWAISAAYLVVRGLTSNRLESGASVRAMQQRYLSEGGALSPFDGGNANALLQLRLAELNRRHAATEAYVSSLNKRARALNFAVVSAAAAPMLGAFFAACVLASSS